MISWVAKDRYPVLQGGTMPRNEFEKVFSPEELEQLRAHSDPATGRLPSWRTVFCNDLDERYSVQKVDYDGQRAVRYILETPQGESWFREHGHRFLPGSEHSEVGSAMAELRCYGGLLEAGFRVNPVPTENEATPDFKVTSGSGTFSVEVASKMETGEETDISRQIAKGDLPKGVSRTVTDFGNQRTLTMTTRVHHPFGKPDPNKPGDTVQANAISKICAIKQKETQVQADHPTLLWIDLRDVGDHGFGISVDQLSSVTSGFQPENGSLTCGAIWYGFYGWKGAPMFEDHGGQREAYPPMKHHGRFNNPDRPSGFSGAIICLHGTTVYFENPSAKHPLSHRQLTQLHALPHFDISRSVASWYPGGAAAKLDHVTRSLEAFERAGKDFRISALYRR